MDAIREFFYWTASIAMILASLLIIGLLLLLFYLKRMADEGMRKLELGLESVHTAARTWRNLAFTRFLVRLFRVIF